MTKKKKKKRGIKSVIRVRNGKEKKKRNKQKKQKHLLSVIYSRPKSWSSTPSIMQKRILVNHFTQTRTRTHTHKKKVGIGKIHLCPVQNMRNLYALPSQMRVQQVSNIKQRRMSYRWPLEEKMETSRLLGSRLFLLFLSSIKDLRYLDMSRRRADTLFFCLFAYFECKFFRSTLEQAVHRSIQCCFMIVVLCLNPSLFLGGRGGHCREQWSCGGTGVWDTAQFCFNSKSVCWVR